MRKADCHPEKKHYVKGLCNTCYDRKNRKKGSCVDCGSITNRMTVLRCVPCSAKENARKKTGVKRPQWVGDKIKQALKGKTAKNENHHAWKGDKVGYYALHIWVKRNFGSPSWCEFCLKTSDDTTLQWANVSNEYRRERNDWMTLCVKCHSKFDGVKRHGFHFRKRAAYKRLRAFEKRHGVTVPVKLPWIEEVYMTP